MGNKGFRHNIVGDFEIDWSAEALESGCLTIVKKHNAEIYLQSALDTAIGIAGRPRFDSSDIREVSVATVQIAYDIIGGVEEGDKRTGMVLCFWRYPW